MSAETDRAAPQWGVGRIKRSRIGTRSSRNSRRSAQAENHTAQNRIVRGAFDYAICSDLCVPAEADLRLTLSGKSGTEEATLVAAEARVPRRVPLGAGSGLAIRSVHREGGNGRQRVVVEVAAAEGMPVDLLVEGPTPDWALPLPEQINSTPGSGVRRFGFDLDGLPSGAHADGATLTFTAVSPDDAVEVGAPLD